MSIEDLSKSQLLLLTILVNFVTAVATGILTVSLLDTAPPIVTQTVNRIVEHTVEKVTQAAPAAVIQAPMPSVEDLITEAFAADAARSVVIYNSSTGTSTSVARGTFLAKARAIIAANESDIAKEVLIGFADGSTVPASLVRQSDTLKIFMFAASSTVPSAPAMALLQTKDLKVGQTALALTRDGGAATGIVTKVGDGVVSTSLPKTAPGAAALDLAGNLIGISLGSEEGVFVSAESVKTLLAATSSAATP